ncbi:CBS domain-containing protein [Roseococcus microcysteis]|uniref:CBS domain-containing protein n=1 Tax=Roseococcus microcysteis TaxID=2771361 RepID=UPI001CC8237A|nr:CBS domain-containing protein [Roseococcus microcysteis]
MPSKMTARDLMTPDVVTVPPETPVVAMAKLMADRGISAVPVLAADGALLGLVTEADLIRRLADEDVEHRPSWFASMFSSPGSQADRYARTHGAVARDVMTANVVAVGLDETAAHIAALMEEKKIRRVLVVEGGKLRGIVSRADLLRALVTPMEAGEAMSDDRIRRAVLAAMKREPWANSFYLLADVQDGIVTFHGFMRDAGVARGLRVLAEGVPGVKGVKDETQPLPAYM